jgi:hypothetical protein
MARGHVECKTAWYFCESQYHTERLEFGETYTKVAGQIIAAGQLNSRQLCKNGAASTAGGYLHQEATNNASHSETNHLSGDNQQNLKPL